MNFYDSRVKQGICKTTALLVLFAVLSSCGKKGDAEMNTGSIAPVHIGYTHTSSLVQYLELNANTAFLKKEIVRATFQAYIQKTMKNIGDHVDEGEVLFYLKTKEASAADTLTTQVPDDFFKGAIPIKAKSNGILTLLNYHTGDFVSDGEQLAIISNPSSIAILLNVPYQNISQIRLNSECLLVFPDGKTLTGRIVKSIPSVDPNAQTQTYLIQSSRIDHLPENLNLTVRVPLKTAANALVVEKGAVLCDETQENFWIMKLMNDSTAVRVNIQKGLEDDTLVQILTPVLPDRQKVVVDGGYGLHDTARVAIQSGRR